MRWTKQSGRFVHGGQIYRIVLSTFLAGCGGLPAPGPRHIEFIRQLPAPPGPYVRVRATADLESEHLSGTFDVLLLARTGPRPLIRLQLLPDLGGKALDLLVSPERLIGRIPATGESIDWELPDDARAHPLLFIAVTLLERFAPMTEDRLTGAISISGHVQGDGPVLTFLELSPVIPGSRVRLAAGAVKWEWRLGWGAWIDWIVRPDEVVAPGFRLKLRDLKIEPLGSLDESLLRLER